MPLRNLDELVETIPLIAPEEAKPHQDILQKQIDWLNSELKRKAGEFETDRSAALEEYIKLFEQKGKLEASIESIKNDSLPLQNQLCFILERYMEREYQFHYFLLGKEPTGKAAEILKLVDVESVRRDFPEAQINTFENTRNVAIFGAGLTYTTIFGAARGRLDFISWASAAFLVAFVLCKWTTRETGPYYEEAAYVVSPQFWNAVKRLRTIRGLLTRIAIAIGIVFITLSVILMDPSSDGPSVGSTSAIHVSGYIPVVLLAILMATYLLFDIIITLRADRFSKPTWM
ncbi:hypothetical protein M422DRAFT_268260 [Sphaerobolus stellatus SS14]|uniref:Uncharacterized protein n=1 Tax=Sphaerobolus stellatus (strain SS14) TaxID=990650 RepID=A0A0C9UMZ5_SPHS4|nr:hypothetical protein M422DRAFT_268260 [Sphaerobolus stellatus SS14]